jgi:hypothetical protein
MGQKMKSEKEMLCASGKEAEEKAKLTFIKKEPFFARII